jgi:hypothetical protein
MVLLHELFHYSKLSIPFLLKCLKEEASLVAKTMRLDDEETFEGGVLEFHARLLST